jgi:succinate dehydrogenase flavin-adding protein (antitoxin of CptAB toxin-antitoxin module)
MGTDKLEIVMNIDGQKIISITEQGLTYLSENGTESFIDFALCYDTYINRFMEPSHLEEFKRLNHMSDDDLAKWLKTHERHKEIAARSIIGDILAGDRRDKRPFIEFHTNPPTRFIFATEDEFHQTRHKIHQFGWRTFDLS